MEESAKLQLLETIQTSQDEQEVKDATEELYEAHVPLLKSLTHKYGVKDWDEAYQAASYGFMIALQEFDIARINKCKISSFLAMHIYKALRSNKSSYYPVKMSSTTRKKYSDEERSLGFLCINQDIDPYGNDILDTINLEVGEEVKLNGYYEDEKQNLRKELSSLSDKHQQVLNFYMRGMSYVKDEEVRKVFNSRQAFGSALSMAIAKIKKCFGVKRKPIVRKQEHVEYQKQYYKENRQKCLDYQKKRRAEEKETDEYNRTVKRLRAETVTN